MTLFCQICQRALVEAEYGPGWRDRCCLVCGQKRAERSALVLAKHRQSYLRRVTHQLSSLVIDDAQVGAHHVITAHWRWGLAELWQLATGWVLELMIANMKWRRLKVQGTPTFSVIVGLCFAPLWPAFFFGASALPWGLGGVCSLLLAMAVFEYALNRDRYSATVQFGQDDVILRKGGRQHSIPLQQVRGFIKCEVPATERIWFGVQVESKDSFILPLRLKCPDDADYLAVLLSIGLQNTQAKVQPQSP